MAIYLKKQPRDKKGEREKERYWKINGGKYESTRSVRAKSLPHIIFLNLI